MKKLFVLYDPACNFCRSCRAWLEAQPAYIELRFFSIHNAETECRFPGIEKFAVEKDLTVVGDDGAVYQGPQAFILCLYALVEFREWSLRLARPQLLPFARQFFGFISNHRATFSRWMRERSDQELAWELSNAPPASCENATLACEAAVEGNRSE
jgi:predicted DCC family thiol-disulfide oxidoreductase YuxK